MGEFHRLYGFRDDGTIDIRTVDDDTWAAALDSADRHATLIWSCTLTWPVMH